MIGEEGKLEIKIDREACIACGLCAEMAPEIFKLDEQLKSEVRPDAVIDPEKLREAARNCAPGAITTLPTASDIS